MYCSRHQLLAVATRLLGACAGGLLPDFNDVRFLNRFALPCQTQMQPAELAGMTIWWVRHEGRILKSAA